MFTNATLLSLYAGARRDEDLRRPRLVADGSVRRSVTALLRRFVPRRDPTVIPVALQAR